VPRRPGLARKVHCVGRGGGAHVDQDVLAGTTSGRPRFHHPLALLQGLLQSFARLAEYLQAMHARGINAREQALKRRCLELSILIHRRHDVRKNFLEARACLDWSGRMLYCNPVC